MNPHRPPADVEAEAPAPPEPTPRSMPWRFEPKKEGFYSTAEDERAAWDRFAAAAAAGLAAVAWQTEGHRRDGISVDSKNLAREAALIADELMLERRERFEP